MDIRELTAQRREAAGKGAVRRLRRDGLVPAILYGAQSDPLPLVVTPREIQRVLHAHGGGGVLVNVRVAGESEPRTAVVRDLQFDPVHEALLHVDLQAVRMDEEITVEVPIHVVGEAVGVKEQSGILAVLLRAVEVACLPSLIPERLEVDVSPLRIHDLLTVADLRLPEGVHVNTAATQAIVTVAPPTAEEPVAVAAPAAEPEVVGEREAEEGEEAPAQPEKAERGEKGEKPERPKK